MDSAGNKINGNPRHHFMNVLNKQQERFRTKLEAFSLLKQKELEELYLNPDKSKVKGSTDKQALQQAYFNSTFELFKAQNKEDLEQIKGSSYDNLNDVEKEALKAAIDIKLKEI